MNRTKIMFNYRINLPTRLVYPNYVVKCLAVNTMVYKGLTQNWGVLTNRTPQEEHSLLTGSYSFIMFVYEKKNFTRALNRKF